MRAVTSKYWPGVTLLIPDGWDCFLFDGRLYRVSGFGYGVRVR